jgi:hypothetical protein
MDESYKLKIIWSYSVLYFAILDRETMEKQQYKEPFFPHTYTHTRAHTCTHTIFSLEQELK